MRTICCYVHLLAIAAGALLPEAAAAERGLFLRRPSTVRGGEENQSSSSSGGAPGKTETETETAKLVFNADCSLLSEPCTAPSRESLVSFFQKPETAQLLMTAGGKRAARTVPASPAILELWEGACAAHNYGTECRPREGDVARTTQVEAHFPGFTVRTTVLVGTRVGRDEKTGLPLFETCLIGDRKQTTGPLAWLFHKLTNHRTAQHQQQQQQDETFQPSETKTKSRISIVESQPDAGGSSDNSSQRIYQFKFDSEFETRVEFPRWILRLLPASKQRVEERGAKIMRRIVSSDGVSAIAAVRDAFLAEQQQAAEAAPTMNSKA